MNSGITKLIRFYLGHSRRIIIFGIAAGILAGVSSSALVALIGLKIASPESSRWPYIWAFCGLTVVDLMAIYISGVLSTRLIQRANFDMRMRLCREILDTPLRNLEKTGNHRLLAVLDQDIPTITSGILQVPQLCINVAVLSGLLIYLGWLSPTLLLVLVTFLATMIFLLKMLEKRADHLMRQAREEWDTLMRHFQSLTEGIKELKLHHDRRETFFQDMLTTSATSYQHYTSRRGRMQALTSGMAQVLYFFVIGLIIFVFPVSVSGNRSQVLMGYALTILYMRGHIMGLLGALPALGQAAVSLRKVEQLGLSLTSAEASNGDAQSAGVSPFWERLELRGASHTYYREREDDNFMLGPINLTLRPGELIFVVGGNGSGKTTLAKMLTGLYIPEKGEILLDGEPITATNMDSYRQLFSVVFSDFFIFDELLGVGGADVDEKAREYIRKLQLDHKVEVTGRKLSTTNLSLGQRKRLALLTAYLEDRPIYLFDEWASGQDPHFKEFFYLRLVPELKAKGKTLIIISHDDRHYHMADRIIKLEDGLIVADRQPAELMDVTYELGAVPA
ncbi:MAG: cyclic peptide export ABC transporter [Acidobacteriota bacterium]